MNIFIKSIVSILIFAAVSNSVANEQWHTSTIKSIYPLADGSVVIILAKDHPQCPSRSLPHYYYLRVDQNNVTEAGLKNIYAAALSAAATGKTITFNFDSSSGGCYINRLIVNY